MGRYLVMQKPANDHSFEPLLLKSPGNRPVMVPSPNFFCMVVGNHTSSTYIFFFGFYTAVGNHTHSSFFFFGFHTAVGKRTPSSWLSHMVFKLLGSREVVGRRGARWLSGEGIGLVIRRLPDRFPAVQMTLCS